MIICLVIRIVESPNTTNEQANIDGQETTEKHLIRMSTVYFVLIYIRILETRNPISSQMHYIQYIQHIYQTYFNHKSFHKNKFFLVSSTEFSVGHPLSLSLTLCKLFKKNHQTGKMSRKKSEFTPKKNYQATQLPFKGRVMSI